MLCERQALKDKRTASQRIVRIVRGFLARKHTVQKRADSTRASIIIQKYARGLVTRRQIARVRWKKIINKMPNPIPNPNPNWRSDGRRSLIRCM